MKTYGLIMVASFFSMATLGCLSVTAQSAGLYNTMNDFQQQKLIYPVDCNNHRDKLKLNELFGSPTGYVVSNGERHSFRKEEVYGYCSCNKENYRFYNKEAFRIVDTAGFYIYYQCKNVVPQGGKGMVKSDLYFFSGRGDSPIYMLTIDNLKKVFSTNISFHYSIDTYFKSDRQLMAYDEYGKMYKLKHLYLQSVN